MDYEELEARMWYLEHENAKLREELADAPKCATCEAMLDCYECLRADDSQKERRRLDYENAKLRELVKSLYRFSFDEYPDGTELNFADKLYMLGIEVDG